MSSFKFGRLIRLLSLIYLSAVLSQTAFAQSAGKGGFCVSDAAERAPGTIQGRMADCPAGYFSQDASCKREAESRPAPSTAPECPIGYSFTGKTCERPALSKPNPASRPADCPDGYTNSGNVCFRLSAPEPLPASRMSCKPGENKVDGRCYKPCEAGSTGTGASCARAASILGADKMSCKAGFLKDEKKMRCVAQCAAGFNNTGEACVRAADSLGPEAMSCKAGETRQGGRCMAAVASCAKGEILQGGSCFAACAPGYQGVGGACWPQAPKAWVSCGIGAAKDGLSCAAVKLPAVAMVKHHAVALGREAGVAAAPGQQVTRLVSLHAKFRELVAAYNGAKDSAEFKRDLAAWSQANQGKEAFLPFDESGAPTTEPTMVRHAVQLATIAGFKGNVDAGAYPKCSSIN
ncbi:MAG: hypothetical protein V4723_04075 [Pseudomonadota bacterium]